MTADSAHGAHEVVASLQPAIALLGLGIAVALASGALRLSPIVGYIVLGAGLAASGFGNTFDGPLVTALAEAGVMFLLFNLGLHFSLSRIREEAANIFGFGTLQMLVGGCSFTVFGLAAGFSLVAALLGGFALALSSTAVVIGLIRERDQEDCPVGRTAQSILIFQDIVAIMLLVVAGALGSETAVAPAVALAILKAAAAFGLAILFSRFATERLFRLISRATSAEVYTATALFLALAAGWATGMAGLSLTLGAFLGGVAIAESRYRILVQTEIEAFRGLFLGFFFISVGLSLDMTALASQWPWALATAVLLIGVKCVANVLAGLLFRWSLPGSFQLGFLLGQGSEFAVVLFAIPAVGALLGRETITIAVAAIALSLLLTPAVSQIGRSLAGKLRTGPPDRKLPGDDAPVVILGLGDSGRAVADALRKRGIGYLAVESDRDRFEEAVADGYDVHYAALGDPRGWEALGMARRRAAVVSPQRIERFRELTPMVRDHLPGLVRFIAVDGTEHHATLREDGARPVDVSTAAGSAALVAALFDELGLDTETTPYQSAL